ncbi:MAG: TIGR00268 family protein [Planctomycetes bacterium HGW-Planctomycetes-1]|nr:MAG: TIGR00268 family protein [Planctomycetes bacterium HGW-Planctomycetes-1]
MTIDEKYGLLGENIKNSGRVVVAYSGGVDSTFLLRVCADTLGSQNVLACISTGPLMPKQQLNKALELAKNMKVVVETVEVNEITDKTFSANKADRCFHCKSNLFKVLNKIAKERGCNHVLCGSNLDDYDDYRPGNRAVKLFKVICPLADAKLTKNEIRQLSRKLNLPTADIPASPCLASRISYGDQITEHKLNQVEQAEEFLKSLGFVEFRVRYHGQAARIEVHDDDIVKIISLRREIAEKLKSLGFKFVSVDLEGFRSGSLNELLSQEEKQKNL